MRYWDRIDNSNASCIDSSLPLPFNSSSSLDFSRYRPLTSHHFFPPPHFPTFISLTWYYIPRFFATLNSHPTRFFSLPSMNPVTSIFGSLFHIPRHIPLPRQLKPSRFSHIIDSTPLSPSSLSLPPFIIPFIPRFELSKGRRSYVSLNFWATLQPANTIVSIHFLLLYLHFLLGG